MTTHSIDNFAFDLSPYSQIFIDPFENRILEINQSARSLLGIGNEESFSFPASTLFGDQIGEWIAFSEEVISNGSGWSDALMLRARDSNTIRLEICARAHEIEGTMALLFYFQNAEKLKWFRDKSEANNHYRSGIGHWDRVAKVFREFERENQLILNAAGEGIYGIDIDGKTTFVNTAAEKMLGWTKEELFGRNIHDVIHHSHRNGQHFHSTECSIFQAIRDGVQRNVDDEVFWTKQETAIEVEYTSTPIKDDDQIIGAVVIFRDVTQKRLDKRRLLDAISEVERLKNRLEMENAYLQEELSSEFNHHHIVGKSAAISQILEKIALVAPTLATVLITGESGTGKELIARAIHEESERCRRSLIRVNCAAIPSDLFESEFFGHRKGAFTGAMENRVGRFELADGGTLFLDEVAEIPLSLQGKLLRVLQEKTFERVGDSNTRTVDVRIIAATNKDLRELVDQGKFREDLYFRLNVFPIESIPLRQRKEDIPLLASHFLKRACTTANKPGLKIPLSQIERMKHYAWPGNIRELENVIERQVILVRGDTLSFSDLPNQTDTSEPNTSVNKERPLLTDLDIKQHEKKSIITALQQCLGKVSGEDGAANLLNIKPTTLASRIKKYHIDPKEFKVTR